MEINSKIQNITGVITVEIEGFFTERFINLCKINNIKIWDIRNIVKGIVRFKMNISDFKKIRKIVRKTKCKINIKEKKGIYFTLFKYRKRKLVFLLLFMLIFFSISFSTFIWNINISGNSKVESQTIIQGLKEIGVYPGKNKIGMDTKQIVNNLRIKVPELSWVGIEINGTTINVKVAEKTQINSEDIQESAIGDIIANKSGVITKIVPENGTAKFKIGSYIEQGIVAIEGTIYSKILEPKSVTAKGILRANCEYVLKREYKYENIVKNYTGKKRYTVGITINSKENIINYLNKSKKYDINKSSKKINIFGNEISVDFYTFVEYEEETQTRTRENLNLISQNDIESYLNMEILPKLNDPIVGSKKSVIEDTSDGIIVTTKYIINEEIGQFVERK
jgi:similar to stage IV sporulation protein